MRQLEEELQAYNRSQVLLVCSVSPLTPDVLVHHYATPRMKAYDGISHEQAVEQALKQLVAAGILDKWEYTKSDVNGMDLKGAKHVTSGTEPKQPAPCAYYNNYWERMKDKAEWRQAGLNTSAAERFLKPH